jgi:hypothetical protein
MPDHFIPDHKRTAWVIPLPGFLKPVEEMPLNCRIILPGHVFVQLFCYTLLGYRMHGLGTRVKIRKHAAYLHSL